MRIDYRKRKISLLTNHGKELIIAPVLERALGCQVEQVQGCDTDQFGSLDRITLRQGTQLQTASDPRVTKGIQDINTLKSAFIEALLQSGNGKVIVENDLRAFCNPTRRLMIEQATEELARKLLSLCPECQTPGFWKIKSALKIPAK